MPIYEYVCTACGRRIDVVHGINAAGPDTCEVCAGAMKKALSTPAIHFKGSGWAKKDARTAAAPSAKADDASGTKGGDGPASTDGTPKDGTSREGAPAPSPSSTTPAPAPAAAAPAATAAPATGGSAS